MNRSAIIVEFENVTKMFGAKVAVDGISFQVPLAAAISGPNGADKPTSIK